MTAISPSPSPPAESQADDAMGGLWAIVFATIPAALAYFSGWAYLYYYLAQFGIGISELNFSFETTLIYAAPPMEWIFRTYWLVVVLGVASLSFFILSPAARVLRVRSGLAAALKAMSRATPLVNGLGAFATLALIAVLLAPMIRAAAISRADEKWTHVGVPIETMIELENATSVRHGDYESCQSRRALNLIMADNSGYFMLCVGELNDSAGLVYEVRRDPMKLSSVRRVRRSGVP